MPIQKPLRCCSRSFAGQTTFKELAAHFGVAVQRVQTIEVAQL